MDESFDQVWEAFETLHDAMDAVEEAPFHTIETEADLQHALGLFNLAVGKWVSEHRSGTVEGAESPETTG